MKRKTKQYLAILLFVASLAIPTIACGGDDWEFKSGGGQYGKWNDKLIDNASRNAKNK